MANFENIYNYDELKYLSADDLLSVLRSHWGYSKNQPLEVIAEKSSRPFWGNMRSVNDGRLLQYPQEDISLDRHNVFIGNMIEGLPQEYSLYKFLVELAPEDVRYKSKSPNVFSLRAVFGTFEPLEKLPPQFKPINLTINDEAYIEKWIVETYKKQNTAEVQKEIFTLNEQRERIEFDIINKKEEFQQEIGVNEKQLGAIEEKINIKKEELEEERKKKEALEKKILEKILFKKDLEKKLEDLHDILREKAERLLALELIDENFYKELCGAPKDSLLRQGHSFNEVFQGDENLAIKYIQAFMYKKGIIYKESLLKSFYALLKTHDLIILAGDSGSGKTNLIKSFAEAIGGKAIIVPVKPNWTSAEDLLGYYNPIEQRFLATDFLEALFEAKQHPDIPYFICLDEMNLARVEYYFADFLSLLEDRQNTPEIKLYSKTEASHLGSEVKNFLALIQCTQEKLSGHAHCGQKRLVMGACPLNPRKQKAHSA